MSIGDLVNRAKCNPGQGCDGCSHDLLNPLYGGGKCVATRKVNVDLGFSGL